MSRPVHLVVPGPIGQRTGGYVYDRRIAEGLSALGRTVVVHELEGAFPEADETARRAAARAVESMTGRHPPPCPSPTRGEGIDEEPSRAREEGIDGAPSPAKGEGKLASHTHGTPSPSTGEGGVGVVDGPSSGLGETALPLIDGLALPAFDHLVDRLPQPWVALIHHPLALETGLSAEQASRLASLERRLLASAQRIVVTSPQTRRDLEAYDIEPDRVGVVLPGTERAPLARGSGGPGCAMLCVASLTPRKGHLVLLEALGRLADLDWRLTCVGSAERDPACAGAIRDAAGHLELEPRIRLIGERDEAELAPFYDSADLFVLASHYEGYGMVLADALAHGLPVVSTTAGAIPDVVPSSAGLLVPPGDIDALAKALHRAIGEPELRARLAEGARAAREHLPGWADAARAFAAELDRVQR